MARQTWYFDESGECTKDETIGHIRDSGTSIHWDSFGGHRSHSKIHLDAQQKEDKLTRAHARPSYVWL